MTIFFLAPGFSGRALTDMADESEACTVDEAEAESQSETVFLACCPSSVVSDPILRACLTDVERHFSMVSGLLRGLVDCRCPSE